MYIMAAKLKYDAEEGDVIVEKKTRNFIQPKKQRHTSTYRCIHRQIRKNKNLTSGTKISRRNPGSKSNHEMISKRNPK
jgi:hypothetical protein